jgi:hypothetical protein
LEISTCSISGGLTFSVSQFWLIWLFPVSLASKSVNFFVNTDLN